MIDDEDENDEFDGMNELDIREELLHRLRTTGAAKAVKTAMKLCDDPKAPAAAKASAVNSLLRAAGFFVNHDPAGEKDLAQMTPAELSRAYEKAKSALANAERGGETDMLPAERNIFD
ncbi:hypothetical protein JQ628_23535 [Bradyrhizobium lablabi]|uniref:hypothetical protein n=1 Tax=Bradyrhizobium lablabi TaxID=722472 RepID=UPI001BAB6A28|nr:hypothetical protein [Bradyrhizobium lablabi]MBR1124519.1 hypothetical protein [Bradyrhizobium lablabi]